MRTAGAAAQVLALGGAVAALSRGATTEALVSLREAWRALPHPLVAKALEALWQRVQAGLGPQPPVGEGGSAPAQEAWLSLLGTDGVEALAQLLPTLMAARPTQAAERARALGQSRDPRAATGLLAALERPEYQAATALRFYDAVGDALVALGDVRVAPALEALAKGYGSVLSSSFGERLGRKFLKVAQQLAASEGPSALDAEAAKVLARLEVLLAPELGAQERSALELQRRQRDEGALLAAIFDNPEDLLARQVYADALSARGDPRGEFITLQLRAAEQLLPPELSARMGSLRVTHAEALEGPLGAVAETVAFARGFPDAVYLWRNKAAILAAVGSPAFATVRTLAFKPWRDDVEQPLLALLTHPVLARLEALHQVDGALLGRVLEVRSFPELRTVWLGPGAQARLHARLPGVTHLGLTHAALETAWLRGLSTLSLAHESAHVVPQWVRAAQDTKLQTLRYVGHVPGLDPESFGWFRFSLTRGSDGDFSVLTLEGESAHELSQQLEPLQALRYRRVVVRSREPVDPVPWQSVVKARLLTGRLQVEFEVAP